MNFLFYILTSIDGKEYKIFDIDDTNKGYVNSFKGGSDEHRSDTWTKILIDEIIPKYLINKVGQHISIHPLDDYRFNIFMKAVEVCKEKYPQIEIKKSGNNIYMVNK